ncbi:hypothetical protein [Microbispora bryophytorum]|nr:hypothetical protein [Microbispora bryophytorum]
MTTTTALARVIRQRFDDADVERLRRAPAGIERIAAEHEQEKSL